MNMCPSYKRKVPPESCLKGQIFFIWSTQQSLHIIQERIFLLGGRVDSFLSKDITTVLVEDTHLLSAQLLPSELTVRPVYPNGIAASNYTHPGVLYNLPSTSRGLNLLSFVTSPLCRVICFARQWGIQVLGIAYFLSTTDPIVKAVSHHTTHPKKSHNVSNLTGCFIKVECYHKKFRPCYKMFNNDPERLMPLRNANILIKPDTCNVILEKPIGPRQLQYNPMDPTNRAVYNIHESKQPVKVNDKKFPNKLKPKEENNYCECCRSNFTDLKLHIKSANHQKFVANEKNYETVNNILKMLPSAQEFIQKQRKPAQTTDLTLLNGDLAHHENENSVVEVDLVSSSPCVQKVDSPGPLNLQVKHYPDNPSPLNLHVPREKDVLSPNLHVRQNKEIKLEPPVTNVATTNVFVKNEILNPVDKIHVDLLNADHFNDSLQCTLKQNDPLDSVKNEALPEEPNPADPLFDKTNSNTLAQLCLKNFDSYWLDNLPNEMDDIIFDDNIFDFDDSKHKIGSGEPCLDPIENLSPSNIAHTPDNDLKAETSVGSFMLTKSVNTKTISEKPGSVTVPEACSPICKMEEEFVNSLSPVNLKASDALVGDKKIGFNFTEKTSMMSFFPGKPDPCESPSCSKVMPAKTAEQMFSSDSSDDENGNVFISNVLNIITFNSDSEMKVDKESSCEEVPSYKSKISTPKKRRQAYLHKVEEICAMKHTPEKQEYVDVKSTLIDNKEIPPNERLAEKDKHPEPVSLVKTHCMLTNTIEHKPSETISNDNVLIKNTRPTSVQSMECYNASSPADNVEHIPADAAPLHLKSDAKDVSNSFVDHLPLSNIKCAAVRSMEQIYMSSVAHTPMTNSEYTPLNSVELTPASSAEHTPARNGEYTPVSNAENTPMNYSEFAPVTYAAPTPVSNSERTPESKPMHTFLSNTEQIVKTTPLTNPDYSLISSAEYSIPSNSESNCSKTICPLEVCNENHVGQSCANSLEEMCVDTDQACISKSAMAVARHTEAVCSTIEEMVFASHADQIQIDAQDRTYWNNQGHIHALKAKRSRVDYHSVSSLIAQPYTEKPKRKKIPHKRSVHKHKRLQQPLYSVSILPGSGLKLKFTCTKQGTFVTSRLDERKTLSAHRSQRQ